MKANSRKLLLAAASIVVSGGLATPIVVRAADAELSYKASPEVYTLLAENDQFRVILATWKPGQRDAWHSHSPQASYSLTDCDGQRAHTPDGKFSDLNRKAGVARLNSGAIASHSLENRSKTECKVVIVERK